uniref:Putative secreted peptide n=1 Tax=Anopheles braziliensis TaxID=58242 RepID=A0A2M3ZV92_9DIPT
MHPLWKVSRWSRSVLGAVVPSLLRSVVPHRLPDPLAIDGNRLAPSLSPLYFVLVPSAAHPLWPLDHHRGPPDHSHLHWRLPS